VIDDAPGSSKVLGVRAGDPPPEAAVFEPELFLDDEVISCPFSRT
jgi:hypothetical protein